MLNTLQKRHYLFLSIFIILAYWALIFIAQPSYSQNKTFPNGIRLVRDDFDRSIYLDRAQWYVKDQIPYKEVFSEYPQFITYFFAIPAIFTTNVLIYIQAFSLLMVVFFIGLVAITLELLELYQKPYWYSLILFLPSFLYHTLNRFDIMPAFLVSLALYLYLKNKHFLTATALVTGFFVKWYPILLVPIFLSQLWVNNRKLFHKILLFILVVIWLVLLTSYLWSGSSLLDAYYFHFDKGFYYESIYYLFDLYLNKLNIGLIFPTGLLAVGLQFLSLSLPAIALVKPNIISKEHLVNTLLFIILIFIFFSAGRSPQFNLWFVPLYLLVVRNRFGIILLIVFDILNYIFYPLGFSIAGTNYGYINDALSLLKNVMYIALFWYLLKGSMNAITKNES